MFGIQFFTKFITLFLKRRKNEREFFPPSSHGYFVGRPSRLSGSRYASLEIRERDLDPCKFHRMTSSVVGGHTVTSDSPPVEFQCKPRPKRALRDSDHGAGILENGDDQSDGRSLLRYHDTAAAARTRQLAAPNINDRRHFLFKHLLL